MVNAKGNPSVFETAKIPSVTTSGSFEPSLLGSCDEGDASDFIIGSPDVIRLEDLERPVEDVNMFLSGLKSDSTRAIAEKKKNLIGDS